MTEPNQQSRYELLRRESLLSWTVLKWGWEHHALSFGEIQDYAILQLESSSDEDIEILAGLSEGDQDEMIQILGKLVSKESVQDGTENWMLASLLSIQESDLDAQGKLDRLQETYAEFNYPERLSKCSIYYVEPEKMNDTKVGDFLSDPLMEMQKVISQLFQELKKKA